MIDALAPISPVRKAVSAGARHRLRGDRRNYPWASGREVLAPPPHVTLAAAVGSAVISGLAAGSAISAGALTIGFSTAAALKTLAVGLLSLGANALLSRNARQGSTNLGSGRVQNARDPITARRVIYGRTRVGGPYIHMEGTRGPGRISERTRYDCVGPRDEQVCTPRIETRTDFGRPDEFFSVVIPLAGHEVDGFEELYFDDITAYAEQGGALVRQDTQYTDRFVNIEVSRGTADQEAFPTLLTVTEDEQWTAEHRGRGVAAIHSIWQWDSEQETLFGGVPNISALVRGRIVYDPRTMSYAWSDNPALCILDFLRGFDVGARRIGVNVSDDEIDYPSFIAAANICDEQVALAAGGSEKRYTLNGTFDLAPGVEPYTIIEEMLTSMAGRLTYIGGRFRLRAASYVAPTITFDAGDLREGFTINTRQPSTQLYNAVRGTFVSPEDLYNPVSYPALVSELFAEEDGERRFADFDLPFTTSPSTAQRLVQIELNRSRQHIGGTLPLDLSALDVAVGDIIAFDYERFGWAEKEFEVQAVSPIVSDVGLIGFDVTVVETSAAVYDWQTSSERPFVAGVRTSLPSAVGRPRNLELIPELERTGDGGTLGYVLATWDESDAVAIDSYEIRYRTLDQARVERVNVAGTSHRLGPFRPNAVLEVSVRARTTGGRYSPYHPIVSTNAVGDFTPPNAPTRIEIGVGFGSLEPRWTNAVDADLAGVAVKRSLTDQEPADEYRRIAVAGPSGTGSFVDSGLIPERDYFYWFASFDRTGNISSYVGPFNAAPTRIAESELEVNLRERIARIEPLDISVSGIQNRIGSVETTLGPLPSLLEIESEARTRLSNRQDDLAETVLRGLTEIDITRDILRDAEIIVDPETGSVRLHALERLENQLSQAAIRVDGVEAAISLSASRTYVDDMIAEAVLDPAEFATFGNLQTRVTQAEIEIDGAQAALNSKASVAEVDTERARLDTVEVDLDALNSEIALRANSADFANVESRLTDAETMIASLDGAEITQVVRDVRFREGEDETQSEALLRGLLAEEAAHRAQRVDLAEAQTGLSARIDENREAEVAARRDLTARIADQASAVRSEQVARITADEALASDIAVLTTERDQNAAALLQESTARTNADEALATQVSQLVAESANTNAALQAEQIARATDDSALAGSIEALQASTEDNAAAVQTAQQAIADETSALAEALQTVQADLGQTQSAAQTALTATGDTANAALRVSVGDQQAALGLGINGEGIREFIVDADRIVLGDTRPFEIIGGQVFIRDALINTFSSPDYQQGVRGHYIGPDRVEFNSPVISRDLIVDSGATLIPSFDGSRSNSTEIFTNIPAAAWTGLDRAYFARITMRAAVGADEDRVRDDPDSIEWDWEATPAAPTRWRGGGVIRIRAKWVAKNVLNVAGSSGRPSPLLEWELLRLT